MYAAAAANGMYGAPAGMQGPTGVEPVVVTNKVLVSNLPPTVTWQNLKDHFKQSGWVTHAQVFHSSPDEAYGTVEFATTREALLSIGIMNGSIMHNVPIEVHESGPAPGAPQMHHAPPQMHQQPPMHQQMHQQPHMQQMHQQQPRMQQMHQQPQVAPSADVVGATGENTVPGTAIFILGLPYHVRAEQLYSHFEAAGEIVRAAVRMQGVRSMGVGVVVFTDPAVAAAAIAEYDNTPMDGRIINVRYDRFNGN